ncbi:hypothetical protein SNE26_26020 [Mucilaginibacter sp. cycad4]|uniref:hypothetical protein n=1 Tax=Mucilaginibacter sp. cycad4 TaxID=3342096 RepID=UPI002AAAD79F|nr:hypothetical protein [Mucilaginibacter gossypii]WPU99477.1 hypothetical protein SNE26_26020 [Mucilaginibacter gossypii]
MAKKFKPIFERTLSEQSELIQPRVVQIQQENLNSGLYNSYRNQNYPDFGTFVRQYSDHREIVRVDAATGLIKTVKVIR